MVIKIKIKLNPGRSAHCDECGHNVNDHGLSPSGKPECFDCRAVNQEMCPAIKRALKKGKL